MFELRSRRNFHEALLVCYCLMSADPDDQWWTAEQIAVRIKVPLRRVERILTVGLLEKRIEGRVGPGVRLYRFAR